MSVFDPRIAASVPHEIVACARKVELWFESQNIKSWKMGNLQSRSDDDEMTDDMKALVARLRSRRAWVSSEGMLTTVDPDCAEAAATIERLERELADAYERAAQVCDDIGRDLEKNDHGEHRVCRSSHSLALAGIIRALKGKPLNQEVSVEQAGMGAVLSGITLDETMRRRHRRAGEGEREMNYPTHMYPYPYPTPQSIADAAYERAAQVCEERSAKTQVFYMQSKKTALVAEYWFGASDEARQNAERIRALKGKL